MSDEKSLMNLRKAQKIESLKQRELERKTKLKEEKEKKSKDKLETEKSSYIVSKFDEIENSILSSIDRANNSNVEIEDSIQMLDNCYLKLDELQTLITSSTYILNYFHLRRVQERYQSLYDKCQKLEESIRPRKKFGFSNVKKENAKNATSISNGDVGKELWFNSKTNNLKDTDVVDSNVTIKNDFFAVDDLGFCKQKFQCLTMNHEQLFRKDAALTELENCEIKLYGGPNTLYISMLKDCQIFCGPVSTSVFIENCKNCTFVLACQQLRIHSTIDCKFYTHITSRIIIEDTNQVFFAPYNWKYKNLDQHFNDVGLDMNINNWNLIDDFNWLSAHISSPNWKLIDEKDRVTSWEK